MRAVITGGASFIGSHLAERLLKRHGHIVPLASNLKIIDNFSSGSEENLENVYCDLVSNIDLRSLPPDKLAPYFHRTDVLFHLAADHGGRGYVETRQVACSNNFAIDNNVFQAAILAGVPKIIYASSGCIYPLRLQESAEEITFLSEDMDGREGGYQPDGLYGEAKLAGEHTLAEMYHEYGIESAACRFFTVYGPRAKENHAIISFIARAFIEQDPWTVWGNGQQVRNWTYVDDIVSGMIAALDHTGAATPINIGTEEQISVDQAVNMVCEKVRRYHYPDYNPTITHDPSAATGPMGRVASNELLRSLSDAKMMPFEKGLEKTIDWYFKTKDRELIDADLGRLLIEKR